MKRREPEKFIAIFSYFINIYADMIQEFSMVFDEIHMLEHFHCETLVPEYLHENHMLLRHFQVEYTVQYIQFCVIREIK